MGETGMGKEFLAQVIHHNSARANGPFVRINCTTISPQSFERDLFRYERGAFAGAEHRKVGLLEQAETGTLFLDEVGELDLAMQGRLLGILQDRSVVSGSFCRIRRTQRHSGRISRDCLFVSRPQAGSTASRFRDDLYSHLNGVALVLPPLGNRVEDIVPLSKRFIAEYGVGPDKKEVVELDPRAIAFLEQYPFPGNVRELQNMIERV